jgi:hypothetical protein
MQRACQHRLPNAWRPLKQEGEAADRCDEHCARRNGLPPNGGELPVLFAYSIDRGLYETRDAPIGMLLWSQRPFQYRNRIGEARYARYRSRAVALELRDDLHRHEKVCPFATGEWECQRERPWNVADSPVECQFTNRSD